jgi:hypothetical protein
MSAELPTLREAFCRRFHCRPDAFEPAVLRRCFPWWSRLPGAIALALRPSWFNRERELIRQLGCIRSVAEARQELENYGYENQRDRSLRIRWFHLRLSRRRFLRLARQTLAPPS